MRGSNNYVTIGTTSGPFDMPTLTQQPNALGAFNGGVPRIDQV